MGPVTRKLINSPVRLYERNLGWLLGNRFVCLTHAGRKSGRRYRTVLEVLRTDEAADEIVVLVGQGPSADWYRNIQAHPGIEMVAGRRNFVPQHRVLDEAEALAVMSDYERRNRWATPVVAFSPHPLS
jgi:deazaflavin-dependent oxidoreductase (nitroreductase family)